MGWITEIVTLVLGLIVGGGAIWGVAKRSGKKEGQREVREEVSHAALKDNVETRRRVDDATRDVPEPDDARDWLRDFSRGDAGDKAER